MAPVTEVAVIAFTRPPAYRSVTSSDRSLPMPKSASALAWLTLTVQLRYGLPGARTEYGIVDVAEVADRVVPNASALDTVPE